jgi:hypothetical protein
MKCRPLLVFIILISLFYSISRYVYAQPTLLLQEKCAEGAKKFFFERINFYGGTWGRFSNESGHGWNKFESHYNKKLDKCFILIENMLTPKNKKEDDPIYYSIELFDVFGGKEYGCFWREQYKNFNWPVTRCEVGTQKCTNEQEFKTLIRPYLEE